MCAFVFDLQKKKKKPSVVRDDGDDDGDDDVLMTNTTGTRKIFTVIRLRSVNKSVAGLHSF